MKKGGIAALAILACVIIGVLVFWPRAPRHELPPSAPGSQETPAGETSGGGSGAPPAPEADGAGEQQSRIAPGEQQSEESGEPAAEALAQPQEKAQTKHEPSAAERYCAGDHDKAEEKALAKDGGLVQLFQHESKLGDAYGCAAAYLDHGGDVNATDSRDDSEHLTPLLFAIQRNDSKMVGFLLAHGADPAQRAGPDHIKPYGYAVSQAFKHRGTDYNKIIAILDTALSAQDGEVSSQQ